MSEEKEYYVYTWYYKGVPVYVGKGKGNRWKHGKSGCSHVRGLNEIYFKGDRSKLLCKFETKSVTNEVAISIENKLTSAYKTPFNFENNENGKKKRADAIKEGFAKSGYKPTGKKANKETHELIRELSVRGCMTREDIAKEVGVGVATVYRVLRSGL